MGLGGSKSNVRGQGAVLSKFPSGKFEYSVVDLQDACNCSIILKNPGQFTRGQILNELRDPGNYSVMCDCLMNKNEQGNEILQGTLTDLEYSGAPVPSNAGENANMGENAAANAANATNGDGRRNRNVVNSNSLPPVEGFVDLSNNNHVMLLIVSLIVLILLWRQRTTGKIF